MCKDAVNCLHEKLEGYIRKNGDLTIEIEKNRGLCQNVEVQSRPSEEGTIFHILFRDDIGWLQFAEGIKSEELRQVFSIVHKYSILTAEPQGDIVTDFWEARFEHVQYKDDDFLKALYHMIHSARNYEDNNQLIQNSVRSFQCLLHKLTVGGDISLLLWRSRFYLGGEKLPYRREASGIVNGLTEYFVKRGIESLNFLESSRDAFPDNILMFTRLFNDASKYDNPSQWLQQKILEKGCSWVQIFQKQ